MDKENIAVEDGVSLLLLDKLKILLYSVVDYNYILKDVEWTQLM